VLTHKSAETRNYNEEKFKSMEKARKTALEMEKEEDETQKESAA